MSDDAPVVLNGRYELHRRIARGGMAEVVLARDQLLERPVAVKIMFPEYASDASFVERFRREAQAAANLNHPNIVGVYDWGREAGTYFIVMEYVDGRSLADILRTEGTLHPQRAADVATDVAAALGFAHRNGVVHRDVKPGNVLISSQGVVKVTDFGIARAISSTDANLTQAGSVMGTATYFSPEQAQGKAVDPRSDLYSLGVVMYEMVCGKPPFQADSPVAVAYKHVQEHAPAPHTLNPEVPAAYEAITLKLLAKNPANRYPSAEDLRTDLRRFREGQPVLAEGVLDAPIDATSAVAPAATAASAGPDPYAYDDGYYEQAPRRRTGWFIAALIGLLVVLGALVFFFYKGLGAGSVEKVAIPDVRNQTAAAATALLTDKGFSIDTRREPSDTVTANNVIDTDPTHGTAVKKGSTVTLVVSEGLNGVRIPPLEGRSPEDAQAALEAAGITADRISVREESSDDVDKGLVTRTDPAAGKLAGADSQVTIFVANGPRSTVPNGLAGMTVEQATAALEPKYPVSGTNAVYDSSVPEGQVVGTSPAGGTHLKPGTSVVINVSKGPAPTTTTPPTTVAPTTISPPTTTAPPTTSAPSTTTAPPTTL